MTSACDSHTTSWIIESGAAGDVGVVALRISRERWQHHELEKVVTSQSIAQRGEHDRQLTDFRNDDPECVQCAIRSINVDIDLEKRGPKTPHIRRGITLGAWKNCSTRTSVPGSASLHAVSLVVFVHRRIDCGSVARS
jgi:hypothetical protein